MLRKFWKTAYVIQIVVDIQYASVIATAIIIDMTIEYGAFENCISLKEISFNDMQNHVMTNISRHNNLPKDFKIVVPDEIYDDEVNAELSFNKKHVISQSGLKLEQFKKNNKDANVYFAIAYLEDITNINIVYDIVRFLKDKYRIDA